jgi:hypothetical protein
MDTDLEKRLKRLENQAQALAAGQRMLTRALLTLANENPGLTVTDMVQLQSHGDALKSLGPQKNGDR